MRQLVIKTAITRRDDGALDRYFNDIEGIGLLSPVEEEELCRRLVRGDYAALNKLILSNLRFVISVAKQYQTQGISLSDLISEGNIGLVRAAYRFDHTKGFRFISYAVWWIRQAITSAIEEQTRLVHLPLNQVHLMNQYLKAAARLEQQHHRKPSVEEVADDLGVDEQRLFELLQHSQASSSLDHTGNDETGSPLHERIPHGDASPEHLMVKASVPAEIGEALKILDQRERDMLLLYFGLSGASACRLEEIAERYCLSIEHTRRLKDGALAKLRNSSYASKLKTCFI